MKTTAALACRGWLLRVSVTMHFAATRHSLAPQSGEPRWWSQISLHCNNVVVRLARHTALSSSLVRHIANLHDGLDLHGDPEWQLGHTDRGPRTAPRLAEHVDEQFRAAVDHLRSAGEARARS